MKKSYLFAFCAAAAVFTACEVSEQFEPAFTGEVSPDEPIELSEASEVFVFTSDPDDSDLMTRTEHDGSKIIWSAGDKIRMGMTIDDAWQGTNGDASSYTQAKLYASQGLSSGGLTANFTVPTNFLSTGDGTYKFYTIYPAAACEESGFSANDVVTVNIPIEQTPAATSFDPAADLMVGASFKTYTSKPTDPIPLMWERLVAHGEITLKNLQGLTSGETVESVTLTAQSGAQLTGSYRVNLKTATVTGAVSASNSVTVSGDSDNLTFDGSNLTFWIGILPVTVTSLTVELETSDATYTREISSCNVTFAGNTHNKLGINMASVTRVEKVYVLVESEPTDWSGDYVFVRSNSGTNYAMAGKNVSANFSSVEQVTVTDNKVSISVGEDYNVRIDKLSNGHYTLKFGDKYLGYTWTSNSNNYLSYSSSFTESQYEWTFELQNDKTVKINNVFSNRYLQLNNNLKDRYACYTGSMWNPNLYRLSVASGGGTTPEPEHASVTTSEVDVNSITQTEATLNGVVSGNTSAVTEVGFYWGTSSDNLDHSDDVPLSDIGQDGSFSLDIDNLDPGTTYYFKAYALETGSSDPILGEPVFFTTKAATPTTEYYVKVTSDLSDWSGDYLIVYETGNVAFNGGLSSFDAVGNTIAVTITDNKIEANSTTNAAKFTIAPMSGGYSIKGASGKYIGVSSYKNGLSTSTSEIANSISVSSGTASITVSLSGGKMTLKYNSASNQTRFRYYTSGQQDIQLYKLGSSSGGGSSDPEVSVTTFAASEIVDNAATFNGSCSSPSSSNLTITERGFYWGTTSNPATKIPLSTTGAGTFSSRKTSGLTKGTTYYYQAYVKEFNSSTSTTTERRGNVISFRVGVPTHFLELPAITGSEDFVGIFYGSVDNTLENRNYIYNYSYSWYASMWVAWPLTASHQTGSGSTSSWRYNPVINSNYQVNIVSNSYGTMYGNSAYARGHQCPNADRKSDDTMNMHTYYPTNQTPQLQNKFNGSIWGSLEGATRNLLPPTSTDTVYVVTGPAYRKVGGSEKINYLSGVSSNANPSSLPIPNYYWKALLKVKWTVSGSSKTVSSACAIGFWFDHREYTSSEHYYDSEHVFSVNQIEQWTGLDLFTNLPDGIESTAESNTNWTTFQNF